MKYYLFVVQQIMTISKLQLCYFLNTYFVFKNISAVICVCVTYDLCNLSYIPEAFILYFPGYRLSAWNLQDGNEYYNSKTELT